MRIAFVFAVTIIAVECVAQEQDFTPRWYFGGGVSSTENSDILASSYNDDVGYVITGGYLFNRVAAFEIGYNDAGTPGYTTNITRACEEFFSCTVSVESDVRSLDVSIVGIYSLEQMPSFFSSWQLYAKVGAAFWDASNKQVLTTLSSGSSTTTRTNTNGVSGMLGTGVGGPLGERVYLRLDVEFFSTDSDLSVVDTSGTIAQVALEMFWRF